MAGWEAMTMIWHREPPCRAGLSAPPPSRAGTWVHAAHNEYAIMTAYAEGLSILDGTDAGTTEKKA